MALVSMTGYGRGEVVSRGIKVEVELSSVNRKQFDVRVSLPNSLSGLEAGIRKEIHRMISRGSVNGVVRISLADKGKGRKVVVNLEAAEAYLRKLRSAGRKLKVTDDIGLSDLMRMPDVIGHSDVTRDASRIWPVLKQALELAVRNLVRMRVSEGRELERDIKQRFVILDKYVSAIRKQVPVAERRFRRQLKKKLFDAGLKVKNTDDRLQKEIMFYIDKTDISEEMVRLDSHFKHMNKLICSRKPVGRALDFLCQEMFREINTIGSKANDAVISRHVVLFKTELESVREQVQNIE